MHDVAVPVAPSAVAAAINPVDFLVLQARTNFAAFVSAVHRPRFRHSAFSARVCRAVDQFVDDVIAGKRPVLVLTAPPQHGKSSLIARCLPPYLFGRLTGELDSVRIASASYAHALAQRNRRDAQSIMTEPIYRAIFPKTSLIGFSGIDNASDGLEVPDGGWLKGVGIGGPLTGFSVDCFAPSTLVDTDCGLIRIDELHIHAKTVKVLSHDGQKLNYSRIKAIGHRSATRLYRITTDAGRVLEVTGNHPVYRAGSYVPASELTPGDVLLCTVPNAGDAQRSRLPQVSDTDGEWRTLLQQILHGVSRTFGDSSVPRLRDAHELSRRAALPGLPQEASGKKNGAVARHTGDDLRGVRERFRVSLESWLPTFLLHGLQKLRTLQGDSWHRKPSLDWFGRKTDTSRTTPQQSAVSVRETSDIGARQAPVRDMYQREESARPSHQREPVGQFCVQFVDPVCRLPSPVPLPAVGRAYEADTVRLVEIIDGPVSVYDIQVEADECLFAGGILAHNCGIIDDAVKNAQEALSEVTQERNRDWYDSVFYTRLQQRSGQVIIGTPWSAQDLLSHVRKLYKDDPNYTLLSFPALNRPDEVGFDPTLPLGALVPHLHDEAKLQTTKRVISSFWWAAMYQQTPLADFGAIFKSVHVQYYRRADLPVQFQNMCMSVDATFKDGDAADFVAAGVWGKTADDRVYLVDGRREQLAFMRTAQAIADLKRKHPRVNRIFIEEAANGAALIDMLKKHFPGLVGVPPLGSKEARAHAVSWAWENKQVYLPHPDECPWIVQWVAEITSFPDVKNDDTVDCMTIALQQLLLRTPIAQLITDEILRMAH